jgi:urea carboxylase
VFSKVLIANRGEIACRIIRSLKALGIESVAVYSEVDSMSRHVLLADQALPIGGAPAVESYLSVPALLAAMERSGAQAVHPGYGFLSENAGFARECAKRGVTFIGPKPDQLESFGLKHVARELAKKANVPLVPGSQLLEDADAAVAAAASIGYPVMLKSTAGGGGIGMTQCHSEGELRAAFDSVRRLGQSNFAHSGVYLEKLIVRARHIEVQIFGDGTHVVALGERECSAQRRNQKVLEETPAPNLPEAARRGMAEAAVRLATSVAYQSAGTVEFIYDPDSEAFYFLEVNTRLQVEHGVTEAVSGVDLVEWMVRQAAGEPLPLKQYVHAPRGHAIEARVYAEDPAKDFQPSCGLLTEVRFPQDVRVDTWVETGSELSPFYDPMVAKLIVHGEDRGQALRAMQSALAASHIAGVQTNLRYLSAAVAAEAFQAGTVTTRYLETLAFDARGVEVLVAGTQTTVQDLPGRLGYWDVGIPPSGPMDSLALGLANRVVGNSEGAAGLEMTFSGPTLLFRQDALIALAGADMGATLDGVALPRYCPIVVSAGQRLELGQVRGAGARGYLAIRGGLDVPLYLGSRSTFTLGRFGGHGGRQLRIGDVLDILPEDAQPLGAPAALPQELHPVLTTDWDLAVLYGPHGAPDFFTPQDIETLFGASYEVHFNSARTGVRLVGPKPQWARADGGEAGLHPSNLHDNAYAVGTVDFTGDMPILLGPDGPSLGGFVCPATVVQAELWKLGQLKAGDKVRFVAVTEAQAAANRQQLDAQVQATSSTPEPLQWKSVAPSGAVMSEQAARGKAPRVVYRRAGDDYLLVEYGPLELDLNLRFRVHALAQWVSEQQIPGLLDLTPGIRSLQIHHDSRRLGQHALVALLQQAEDALGGVQGLVLPSRIVHLPLSWDDPATRLAIEKYTQGVRKDAPWCPSNIEFIRRINGLGSHEDVRRIVFDASYLVLGLGDVYLGAPVATPLDPRHRLVTTKYNPARTWTPENAVGIGGAYMCIYGMEGPGGYQFVGRTLQVYNRFRQTKDFVPGKPWLLRFFDQIRYYPVSATELLELRRDFASGRHSLEVQTTEFHLEDYQRFLAQEAESISAFKQTQQAAFEAERQRWVASGQLNFEAEASSATSDAGPALAPGASTVESHIPGSVWKVRVKAGDLVQPGDVLVVLESMKMEISVSAAVAGKVTQVLCREGSTVNAGEPLLVVQA